MIRLGTVEDLPTILTIVEEAKSIMQQENNNQWDEQYPLKSHFKEDISKDSLFVLEEKDTIFAFIVVDQQQSEWYDELAWPIDRKMHTLFIDWQPHQNIKVLLQNYLILLLTLLYEIMYM